MAFRNRPMGPGSLLCCLPGRPRDLQGQNWEWCPLDGTENCWPHYQLWPLRTQQESFLQTWMLCINRSIWVQEMPPEWARVNILILYLRKPRLKSEASCPRLTDRVWQRKDENPGTRVRAMASYHGFLQSHRLHSRKICHCTCLGPGPQQICKILTTWGA